MKRLGKRYGIGILLVLFAVCFVGCALTHSEADLPLGNHITYTIYLVYLFLTISVFAAADVARKRR